MVNWAYPYVYSRAKGILSRLLSSAQVEEILRGDISTLLQVLLNTSYRDITTTFIGSKSVMEAKSSITYSEIMGFEHAARENLFKRLETLITRRTKVPPECMTLVSLEFEKFELENIKQVLKILHHVETEGEDVSDIARKHFFKIVQQLETEGGELPEGVKKSSMTTTLNQLKTEGGEEGEKDQKKSYMPVFFPLEYYEVPEDLKKFFIPTFYPLEYYENLLELGSISRAIEAIKDKRLKKELLKVYKDYKRTREYSVLESAMDTVIYRDLRNLIKYSGGDYGMNYPDKFQLYRLVSQEIDLVNMVIIMRCLLTGMDSSDYIIPANFALQDKFSSVLNSETVTEALTILARTPYKHIVDQIESNDDREALYEFEILSKRYMVKRIKSSLSVSPLSMMCVYCFLELGYYELKDIITLLIGKLNKLDPATIKSKLILIDLDGG